jgi:hypothetical protein
MRLLPWTYSPTRPCPRRLDHSAAAHADVLADLLDQLLAGRLQVTGHHGGDVSALGGEEGIDDLVDEGLEVVVAGDEVGLGVDLDHHAVAAVLGDASDHGRRRRRCGRPSWRP